ncbi:hypothetical protein JOD82_002235 [Paenibacillus sp. 1182]|uniref:DUF4262 domain-containing protein n=1 Tax=Paenibacillus sp. 1182 TaxID=2806565 RepID=UPI001AE2A8F6|nr:DUF4262 domain-containing protein [Paenibacillus sp. 1182]MBP1309215.1 hypothetical protein [Paenibacillus sp. 1182]
MQNRLKQVQEFKEKCIQKYGFYVDLDPSEGKDQCNYHTHGVLESFGHLDLQIVFPIDPKIAGALFHSVVDEIRKGQVFQPDVEYFGMVADPNMPMVFKEVCETDRKVLRMLIPDRKGIVPGKQGCDPVFDVQWRE